MKSLWAFFMVVCLTLTGTIGFAEDAWLEPYPEPVKVTFGRYGSASDPLYPEGESIDNNQYTKWIKEQFNIEFENKWLVSTEEFDAKISLGMVTGDLPDIFMVRNKTQLVQLIESGMLADLTDAIDTYSSDLMQSIYASYGGLDHFYSKNVRDADGRIYAIPYSAPGYEFTLTWIRQDWLDKLGLKTPETWSELEDTARAFIEHKMGGEHTTGIEIANSLEDTYCYVGSPGQWFHNFSAYPGNWLKDGETGRYVYGSVQPENKEALAYIARLYKEGLIDFEFATKDWQASIMGGTTGITFGAWWIGAWPLSNTKANDPQAEWVPLWIKDDEGKYRTYKPDIDSESIFWVVNASCKNPEVLVKMANIMAEQQNLYGIEEFDDYPKHIPLEIDTYYSDIGYKFDFQAWPICAKIRYYDQLLKLQPVWMELVNRVQRGEEIPEFATESFDGKKIVEYMNGEDQSPAGLHVYTKTLSLQLIQENKDSLVEQEIYVPRVTPTMELAWSNLKDLEQQTFVKIIMGELPLEAFDSFVEDWHAQGGEMITAEVNEAAGL